MENFIAEFLKLLFQPPVMILLCLAVAGLADMSGRRGDRKFNASMEWRTRESVWRQVGFDDEFIERLRRKFYEGKRMKVPKASTIRR